MDRLLFESQSEPRLEAIRAREFHQGLAREVLLGLRRRRGLVAVSAVLVLGMGVALLSVMKPKYTSHAVVQLDLSGRPNPARPDEMNSVSLDASALVQGEVRILRSPMMARRVVAKLGIAKPERAARHPVPGWLSGALNWGNGVIDRIAPRRETVPVSAAETAASQLLSGLTVENDSHSYLISVGFTADDPARAARVANGFADAYIEYRIAANFDAAVANGNWLAGQIRATKEQIRQAESAISSFRASTGLVSTGPGGEGVRQQQLRELAAQVSAASLARINQENRLARVRKIVADGGVPSASDIQGSPQLQRLIENAASARRQVGDLSAKFGEKFPDLIRAREGLADIDRQIELELERAVQVVEADVAAARRNEADLRARLADMQHEMVASAYAESELRDLQATADMARDRLKALTHSYEQALSLQQLKPVMASVAIPAEPPQFPSSPKPLLMIAVALVFGAAAGTAGAVLLERVDSGFRTGAQTSAVTGLRCLGLVPELSRSAMAALEAGKSGRPQRVFDEAIRSVGAGLGLIRAAKECRVILITSSVQGEGKSALAMALARALVAAGQRVIVLDLTPQRGGSGTEPTPAQSLEYIISGRRSLAVIRRGSTTHVLDPFVFTSFERFVAEARRHCDVLIAEAPPVLCSADAFVLGHMADSVVHVARWNATKRRVVMAALNRLREQSMAVDALVLTRVNLSKYRKVADSDDGLCNRANDLPPRDFRRNSSWMAA